MSDFHMDFVTIVAGLPRSGTSLLMQMIAAGGIPALTDEIRAADDDNPRGYWEFEPVKQTAKDASWLATAQGKVVKMVYRLLYDLPATHLYRVVFTERKLEQVLASQKTMLARQGRQGAALTDEQLLTVFANEVQKCREWLSRQPNFTVFKVNYNDLIQQTRTQAEKINQFLGGSLDIHAMTTTVVPSLYHQRC